MTQKISDFSMIYDLGDQTFWELSQHFKRNSPKPGIFLSAEYWVLNTIVEKVENMRALFAAGGQTNEFLQFKLDLICMPMF